MATKCEAEEIFLSLHDLLKKLVDNELKSKNETRHLNVLLDKYWDIECPGDNDCIPTTCSYAKTGIDWIEYEGYTCLANLINSYEYEGPDDDGGGGEGIGELTERSSIDPLKAHWARRKGHYNP